MDGRNEEGRERVPNPNPNIISVQITPTTDSYELSMTNPPYGLPANTHLSITRSRNTDSYSVFSLGSEGTQGGERTLLLNRPTGFRNDFPFLANLTLNGVHGNRTNTNPTNEPTTNEPPLEQQQSIFPNLTAEQIMRNLTNVIGAGVGRTRRQTKRASDDAIQQLKKINPQDLKESERSCPICYEPYDNSNSSNNHTSKNFKKRRLEPSELDPPIWFPVDVTGRHHSEYFKKSDHNSIEQPHMAVQMPCNHIFGRSCLLEWLKTNTSCPLCRQEVESLPPNLLKDKCYIPGDWTTDLEPTHYDPSIPFPILSTNSRRRAANIENLIPTAGGGVTGATGVTGGATGFAITGPQIDGFDGVFNGIVGNIFGLTNPGNNNV